ncbi:unnamed protein product [Owenia fusiformis]|uniref:Uncharacterized protein n=1 Tax=Owenia fusiformis TaxID=6347 RepID=A0A8J1XV18_OWEFU|nr:unnamed protein product [Owenia fusiformis]
MAYLRGLETPKIPQGLTKNTSKDKKPTKEQLALRRSSSEKFPFYNIASRVRKLTRKKSLEVHSDNNIDDSSRESLDKEKYGSSKESLHSNKHTAENAQLPYSIDECADDAAALCNNQNGSIDVDMNGKVVFHIGSEPDGKERPKKDIYLPRYVQRRYVHERKTSEPVKVVTDEPEAISEKNASSVSLPDMAGTLEPVEAREGSTEKEILGSDSFRAENGGKLHHAESTTSTKSQRSVSSDKKKKGSNWYNVLSPTYKSKSYDFRRIFKDLPQDERLIVDYSCALQKEILVHGRLYVTQNWICFYANIFRWETVLTIRCKDISALTKEKTARVIPNAIQILTKNEKYFFTSLSARDKTYLMLFRVWQNALMDQPMSAQELWQWVHYSYGDELGLTSSDDDYVQPEDDSKVEDKEGTLTPNMKAPLDSPASSIGLANGDLNHSPVDSISMCSDDVGLLMKPVPAMMVTRSESMDGPANAEVPTDMGDTTDDDEEGEVACTGHDHMNLTMINDIYEFSVDQMFEMLFTDSKFSKDFTEARKTTDLVTSHWTDDDAEGNKTRTLSYTLSLNHALGPKTSIATEKQVCYAQSKPGIIYVVDCEVANQGIPYADSFYVVQRYCITRVLNHKCRLRITSEIKYKKYVFGLVKNFIDKNTIAGLNDHYGHLAESLRKECDRLTSLLPVQAGKKKVRKRRKSHTKAERIPHINHTPSIIEKQTPPRPIPKISSHYVAGQMTRAVENQAAVESHNLVRVVCAVLILLVMFNALLFYKLWSIEGRTVNRLHTPLSTHIPSEPPESPADWASLLERQEVLHNMEIDRWKDILSSSIEIMEQMKQTLVELKDNLDTRRTSHHEEL